MRTANATTFPTALLAIAFAGLTLGFGSSALGQGDSSLLPWSGEIFEAPADKVLEGSRNLDPPPADETEYLLWDDRVHIDKEHRAHRIARRVYRIQSLEDVEERGSLSAVWSPWIAEKPIIRARVITPDGKEHRLDPKTIAETAGSNRQDQMFLDHKMLSAPLPAVSVGAVVETEIVTNQHQPFCAEGIVGHLYTERFVECAKLNIELTADPAIDLSLCCVGQDVPLEIKDEDGKQTWRYRRSSPDPVEGFWPYMPKSVPYLSYVTYSTGQSWNQIARYYHQLVENQIKDAGIADFLSDIERDEPEKSESVRRACRKIFDTVRFTGVEFGLSKIQPGTPLETLSRRYGDCKDQAALLIAMLQEMDIESYAALLNVASHVDLSPDAYGLNAFDHVIVYIPAQDGLDEHWIDMTAPFTAFGQLPASSQNRLALIASASADDLKLTPSITSDQNRRTQHYTYRLSVDEPSRISVVSTAIGSVSDELRASYGGQPRAQLIETATENFKALYGLTKLHQFDYSDSKNTADPIFKADFDFEADQVAFEEDSMLTVTLRPGAGFNRLPYNFVSPRFEPGFEEDDIERPHDFEISPPFSYHTSYHLIPPKGFVIEDLPESYDFRIADFKADLKLALLKDGSVRVDIQLDTGRGTLTPDQAESFRDEFLLMSGEQTPDNWVLPIRFAYIPRQLIHDGNEVEGIRQMIEAAQADPDSLFNRSELASALLAVGLGEEAREIAQQMTKDAPESARAQQTVGWTHMHNLLGKDLTYGMDRPEALKAYQRTIELDDENTVARYNYAVLLEHDDYGGRYSDQDDLRKASEAYEWFHKMYPWNTALINHAVVLGHLRDKRRLRRMTSMFPDVLEVLPPLAALESLDRGIPSGDRLLARAGQQDKQVLRTRTIAVLRSFQEYDLLREYIKAFPNLKNAAGITGPLRPYQEVAIDPAKPESALQLLLATYLDSGQDVDSLRSLYVDCESDADFYEQVESIPAFFRSVRGLVLKAYGRRDSAKDIVSLYEFSSEGSDKHGYAVTARPREGAGLPAYKQFAVKVGDQYKILIQGKQNARVGTEILNRMEQGDFEAARAWIDRIYEYEKANIRFLDPFSASPFAQTRSFAANDDEDSLRLAALCLATRNATADDWLPKLKQARENASSLQQLQLDRVKNRILQTLGHHEESLAFVTELLKGYPKHLELVESKFLAEIALGNLEDAESSLAEIDSVSPFYASLLRRKLEFAKGGHDAVYSFAEELVKENRFPDHSKAMMAWRSLFVGKSEQAIEQAKQSIQTYPAGDHRQAAALHTLACVYADTGQLRLAAATMRTTIETRNGIHDGVDDWVLGRIAEQLGLHDAAKKYYERVPVRSPDPAGESSCRKLAEMRLAGMKQD